jgi:cysteine desulfurase/selenocysteine lyase
VTRVSSFEKSIFQPSPMRFEAGTSNIADAVGLGAALDYVDRVGMENIARYEHELLQYGTAKLREIPRLRLIGTAKEKAGVIRGRDRSPPRPTRPSSPTRTRRSASTRW